MVHVTYGVAPCCTGLVSIRLGPSLGSRLNIPLSHRPPAIITIPLLGITFPKCLNVTSNSECFALKKLTNRPGTRPASHG